MTEVFSGVCVRECVCSVSSFTRNPAGLQKHLLGK